MKIDEPELLNERIKNFEERDENVNKKKLARLILLPYILKNNSNCERNALKISCIIRLIREIKNLSKDNIKKMQIIFTHQDMK